MTFVTSFDAQSISGAFFKIRNSFTATGVPSQDAAKTLRVPSGLSCDVNVSLPIDLERMGHVLTLAKKWPRISTYRLSSLEDMLYPSKEQPKSRSVNDVFQKIRNCKEANVSPRVSPNVADNCSETKNSNGKKQECIEFYAWSRIHDERRVAKSKESWYAGFCVQRC